MPSRIRYDTEPAFGAICADSNCSSVDLPEPDSPTIASTSPGYNAKDTSRQAFSRPNDFDRPSAISSGWSSTFVVTSTMLALRVRRALAAAMAFGLPRLAIIGVGANEHPAAGIIGDDFVEIG